MLQLSVRMCERNICENCREFAIRLGEDGSQLITAVESNSTTMYTMHDSSKINWKQTRFVVMVYRLLFLEHDARNSLCRLQRIQDINIDNFNREYCFYSFSP